MPRRVLESLAGEQWIWRIKTDSNAITRRKWSESGGCLSDGVCSETIEKISTGVFRRSNS